MTNQEIHHRLDVRTNHLAARIVIAIVNLLGALFFSPTLFFSSIYLTGVLSNHAEILSQSTFTLLFGTLGSLAVVVFSTATAVVALRKGYWRLKYQLFCLAGGVIVAVPWVLKEMRGGYHPRFDPSEIRDEGASAELKQLIQEIDAAREVSNQSRLKAQAMFDKLLSDVHHLGLATVRQEQKEVAREVTNLFGKSVEQNGLAAKKSEEAAEMEPRAKFKPFFTHKARSYEFYAEVLAINQEIVRLVFDESIADAHDLMPKIEEAEKRRSAAGKSGNEAEARANAIAKEVKDDPR